MATLPSRSGRSGAAISMAFAFLAGAMGAYAQAPAMTKLKKILVLDKSQGGAGGHLESRRDLNAALATLAAGKGFAITTIGQNDGASKISAEFSAASLATYQVVIFSNNDGVDMQLDAASKANLETYVKNGGGFLPVHAASAFISNWPWLTRVLVQTFYGPFSHNQTKANLIHDPDALKGDAETKGIFKGLTAPLAFQDEFYSFKQSPRDSADVTILVTVDEGSYTQPINGPMGADHPVVWAKTEGKGRVLYMSLGHSWTTNNVFTANSNYLTNLLYGELRYAAGDFLGCTDPAFKEYNPDATKSDPAACRVPVGIRITAHGTGDHFASLSRSGADIRVDISSGGPHEAALLDMSGKAVYRRTGTGPARYDLPLPARAGIYVVKARSRDGISSLKLTLL
jgi:uncharacterized protein